MAKVNEIVKKITEAAAPRQLPAEFEPRDISPVLVGKYDKRHPTAGYFVGNESAGSTGLAIGDPVIITGNVQYQGKTGDVREIGRDGAFVVVDLYNYGPRSFHSTDVSLNDYADSDDEAEYQQGVAEGSLEEVSQQTLQSYRKKASAQKRAADDVVSGDADDETWKKNVNLSAKRRKGIDSANKRLGVAEGSDSEELANEVYREFERIYPNLARRADERTVHAAIMDVLNYGGDNNPAALAQDVARTVRRDIEQGVAEGVEIVDQDSDLDQQVFTLNVDGKTVSFTYWDYENNFQNPDIKDIYQQAQEQLGKKLSPEQIKAVARSVFKSFKSGVAEGSDNISSMIQQYEDMVELVYDLLPGRKKNIAIDKRDALEAQIEAMPGGVAALRKWAKSYNDAVDEGVAEGSEREMDLDWHYKNIMQTKGLSDKAKKQTTDIYNKLKKKKQQGVAEASDISGLIAAASMVRDYIVTAEVDGQTKRFRVRGMTGPTAARERFLKHASQARVIDVKPVAAPAVSEGWGADQYHLFQNGYTVLQKKQTARPGEPEFWLYHTPGVSSQEEAEAVIRQNEPVGKFGSLEMALSAADKSSGLLEWHRNDILCTPGLNEQVRAETARIIDLIQGIATGAGSAELKEVALGTLVYKYQLNEVATTEDVVSAVKRKLGDYLQDVVSAIKKDPDLLSKVPSEIDQIQAVKTITTDDGHEIKIHGNEDDGFRISIKNKDLKTTFENLGEAVMAAEMYNSHRHQSVGGNYVREKKS